MALKAFVQQKVDDIISPILEYATKKATEFLFDRFFQKHPDHAKVAITSLYPPVDVELEKMVHETEPEYDDAIVSGLKEGMENVADKYGVELPNLDED